MVPAVEDFGFAARKTDIVPSGGKAVTGLHPMDRLDSASSIFAFLIRHLSFSVALSLSVAIIVGSSFVDWMFCFLSRR